jgi:hypothetical protein
VPHGRLAFNTWVESLEQAYGHGLRVPRSDAPDRLETVIWQDANTRAHVIDNSTFFGAFCLVFEDKGTVSRLSELRHNAPAKNQNAQATRPVIENPQVGNVEGDSNTDIVDRITGKIRRSSSAPGPANGNTTNASATPSSNGNNNNNQPSTNSNINPDNDSTGLGGL